MLRKMLMASFLIFTFTAPAMGQGRDLVILVDLSNSAAHLASAPLAAKIAAHTAKLIAGMPLGGTVRLRTFGLADATQNWLALDYRLLRKRGSQPRQVAEKINLILANLPKLVATKKLAQQKATHILRTLQDLAGHACASGGTLVIISDLMEYSPDADCYRLVKDNRGRLPAPADGLLCGVKVIAIGAGHGLSTAKQSLRLKAMWSEWFKRAGVAEFQYLPRL